MIDYTEDDKHRAIQIRMWALEHVCPDWDTKGRLEAAEQIFNWVMDGPKEKAHGAA